MNNALDYPDYRAILSNNLRSKFNVCMSVMFVRFLSASLQANDSIASYNTASELDWQTVPAQAFVLTSPEPCCMSPAAVRNLIQYDFLPLVAAVRIA